MAAPNYIDPATGQPAGAFWGAPEAQGPGAPLAVPAAAPRPVNNKFGGFEVSQGPGILPVADPTGPALPPAGTVAPAEPFPIPVPGGADAAGAGAQSPWGPAPMPTPGQSNQPAMIPSKTTETTKQTSGPDAATTANINAATGEANAAAQAAGKAGVDQNNATAAFERSEAQSQYGRGVNDYFTRAGEMQTQDAIIRETSAKLEETAKFKPDRTALFHGDNGTLFGISAAIAAMAGGWLMGQGLTGGKNPYLETVMRMIDDNANDQIQANSTVYQELTRRLGSAQAAQRELKARMLEAVGTTVEAQSRFNKAQLVQQGSAALMAETQKEVARNRLEAAKLTGQTTTKTVQSRTQMVPNLAAMGGLDLTDPKEYAKVGKVAAVTDFAAEAESLARTGELASSVGFFDEKWDYIADAARARSPGAAKVDALKAKWELMMRSDWASEPNGQETQRRLSSISFPRQDSEIPIFLNNVRSAVNHVDPGGRYRIAARAMGNQPQQVETRRIPVVR